MNLLRTATIDHSYHLSKWKKVGRFVEPRLLGWWMLKNKCGPDYEYPQYEFECELPDSKHRADVIIWDSPIVIVEAQRIANPEALGQLLWYAHLFKSYWEKDPKAHYFKQKLKLVCVACEMAGDQEMASKIFEQAGIELMIPEPTELKEIYDGDDYTWVEDFTKMWRLEKRGKL